MLRPNENLENKEKVKYDLYKILRMSILLNQNETDKLTLDKFKEASLNIDKMLGEVYDEKIDTMFYDTNTLEEEEKRLKELVTIIIDRMEKRKSLLEDYRSVTNRELDGLDYINKSNDLDLYETRLKTIKGYLDNSKLIEVNEQDLEILKEQLVKEYDLKSSNELKNIKIEETLYNTFVNALYEMDLYSSFKLDNIDKEIEDIQKEIKETKDQKDTFEAAFNNLKASGISGDLELEYSSYVENSRRNYYYVKEKEILLKIYKLVDEKESEYSNLYKKREDVKSLLKERILLRRELNIKDKDLMSRVFDLVCEQDQEIETEKENVDNINVLTERIKLKENRLEELNKLVKKPEVLAILKEYGLIDTYDHDDIYDDSSDYMDVSLDEEEEEDDNTESALNLLNDLLKEDEMSEINEDKVVDDYEEFTFEEEDEKEYLPNQIKDSLVVPTMNFGLSRLKSISVMKRVGDMLGINAKPTEEKIELKIEEKVEEPKVEVKEEIVEETPIVELKDEELFWTPNEFVEMKNEEENVEVAPNVEEPIFIENSSDNSNGINDNQIFEFKMPEMKEQPIDDKIFENQDANDGLIFPEPIFTENIQKALPENKEDKFMWPDNMETFDINGIFPS